MIVYNFKKKKGQEQEQEQTQKQEDTVKEKGYVYEPKTKPVDWGFFNVIAGATIIAITIGEDVVTLGAGIADDAASFAFGFSLIFGY